MKFDDVVKNCGFGCQQKTIFLVVIIPTLFCAFHSLSWTFTAPGVTHRCRTEDESELSRNEIQYHSDVHGITCDKFSANNTCEEYRSCEYNGEHSCPYGFAYEDYSRYTAVERVSL